MILGSQVSVNREEEELEQLFSGGSGWALDSVFSGIQNFLLSLLTHRLVSWEMKMRMGWVTAARYAVTE